MTEENATPQEIVENPQITVEELQAQLAQLQETSKQFEENWKREQRVGSQKEVKFQQLQEQLVSNESQSNIVKALIATIAQQKGQPAETFEEEIKEKQPDLLKQYEEISKQVEQQRQIREMTSRIKDIQERTENLLTPQDDDYEVIRAFAEAGKFDKADARLNKIEQAKQTKPIEADEDRIQRLADEKLRQELEKRGLLTQETGGPSASASSRAEKIAKYARGETSEYPL